MKTGRAAALLLLLACMACATSGTTSPQELAANGSGVAQRRPGNGRVERLRSFLA